jgi:hypothetical protein
MAKIVAISTGIVGPRGEQGIPGPSGSQGPQGPAGSITNFDSGSFVTTSSFNTFTSSINTLSSSFDERIRNTTNEQDLSIFATTGSNVFKDNQTISGSILVSGSIIPNTGNGTFTSSFSLGSATNAWKDLYISHGSIVFVDAATQSTSSFSIDTNVGGVNTVKYTADITASRYLGDGSGLYNLPSNTNWNKGKEYRIENTEQLTFSGDYILEDSYLLIDGYTPNSIGEWTTDSFNSNGTATQIGRRGYEITGSYGDGGASNLVIIKRYFDTATTMSVDYVWECRERGDDWPIYEVSEQEPFEPNNINRLVNQNSNGEFGTWVINVPANNWVSFGVWSDYTNDVPGILQLTFPYLITGEEIEYSSNKAFKKEGKIFIGGNLLVKDSYIENNGQISVGGEVILIGDSQIEGTGIII